MLPGLYFMTHTRNLALNYFYIQFKKYESVLKCQQKLPTVMIITVGISSGKIIL